MSNQRTSPLCVKEIPHTVPPLCKRGGIKGGGVGAKRRSNMTIPQSVPMPAPFTQGSLQCGKSPRGGRQKISAATGRSTNERVALGLENKGYARPAFGGTSRRRSIKKAHRLSGRVSLDAKGRGGTSPFHGFIRQCASTSAKNTEKSLYTTFTRMRSEDPAADIRKRAGHKVRRRTIPVRRPLFRGIYHLFIPLIPESSFRRSYLHFFQPKAFSFLLVETP